MGSSYNILEKINRPMITEKQVVADREEWVGSAERRDKKQAQEKFWLQASHFGPLYIS